MKKFNILLRIIGLVLILNTVVLAQEDCEEEWMCTDWGLCEDGIKTRECNDQNKCGTETNKPFGSLPCSTEEVAESEVIKEEIRAANIQKLMIIIPIVLIILIS